MAACRGEWDPVGGVGASPEKERRRQKLWRKPMLGQLILNVDAAFSEEENTGACGTIIRDSRGMFMGAATAKLEHVADVVAAEAAALGE